MNGSRGVPPTETWTRFQPRAPWRWGPTSLSDRTSGPWARPTGGPCLHLNCNVSLFIPLEKKKKLGHLSIQGEEDGGAGVGAGGGATLFVSACHIIYKLTAQINYNNRSPCTKQSLMGIKWELSGEKQKERRIKLVQIRRMKGCQACVTRALNGQIATLRDRKRFGLVAAPVKNGE